MKLKFLNDNFEKLLNIYTMNKSFKNRVKSQNSLRENLPMFFFFLSTPISFATLYLSNYSFFDDKVSTSIIPSVILALFGISFFLYNRKIFNKKFKNENSMFHFLYSSIYERKDIKIGNYLKREINNNFKISEQNIYLDFVDINYEVYCKYMEKMPVIQSEKSDEYSRRKRKYINQFPESFKNCVIHILKNSKKNEIEEVRESFIKHIMDNFNHKEQIEITEVIKQQVTKTENENKVVMDNLKEINDAFKVNNISIKNKIKQI